MPKWKTHIKWSKKIGIPDDVARYTNGVIDAVGDYPEDFTEYINKVKIPRPKDKAPFSIADLLTMYGRHDFGKKDFIKRKVFPFFRRKGEDYVKAWYLHFILDYLVDLKDWRKDTGEGIEEIIDKYQKNKAVTFWGTEEQLVEVINFLKNNTQELQKDLDLPE